MLAFMDMSNTAADVNAQSQKTDRDLTFSQWIPGSTQVLYRLREGVERFFITDINNPGGASKAQSSISVALDELSTETSEFNHIPGGCNVLYMDGHVAWEKYPGEWPVTRMMATITGM